MDPNHPTKLRCIGVVFVVTMLAGTCYLSTRKYSQKTVVLDSVNESSGGFYGAGEEIKKIIPQTGRKLHLIINATTPTGRDVENFLHNNDMHTKPKHLPQTKKNIQPRIVGGTAATAGEFPFYAKTRPTTLCGATLVWEDILLTAAHCGGGFLNGAAIGGTLIDDSDATIIVDVISEIPHPDYNDATQENDIMLVKLQEPVLTVPFVVLNTDTNNPATDDVVTTIGFGDTSFEGEVSDILLKVDVDTFDDQFCDEFYLNYFPETMICAGTESGGRDSCQGDSGGPLLMSTPNNVQVGVVSSGSKCGEPNTPAIYTEVAAYQDWIRTTICSNSANPPDNCNPTAVPAPTPPVPTVPVPNPTAVPVAAPATQPVAPVPNPAAVPVATPTIPPVAPVSRPTMIISPTTRPMAPISSPVGNPVPAPITVSLPPIVFPTNPSIRPPAPSSTVSPNRPSSLAPKAKMMKMDMNKMNMKMKPKSGKGKSNKGMVKNGTINDLLDLLRENRDKV